MIINNKQGAKMKKSRAEAQSGWLVSCCFKMLYLEFLRLSQNRNSPDAGLKAR